MLIHFFTNLYFALSIISLNGYLDMSCLNQQSIAMSLPYLAKNIWQILSSVVNPFKPAQNSNLQYEGHFLHEKYTFI